ncbi:hypothetical protein GGD54_004428 [Rhizobium tropici]|uniref:Uncharacterized protein n=1 Tax=Rhizobium tropici TaxID=398 RepID=A0ABR6R3V4_RHITR|nr:hypothetical protein [Rhizobium tropici]MBB5595880.1 hypothetical protein [Rhizobium tropici]MBB6493872.1 hypothetical protein [Rhizobium tropici]
MLAEWGVLVPLISADPIAFAGEFPNRLVGNLNVL